MQPAEKPIRVRFAPSPTGYLHVGGARTALYNWLFARSRSGSFILRIEDTDTSRSTDEAIVQIISSMEWLGLGWDEGPGRPGAYGPYRQMERAALYRQASGQLLSEGKAYRCYCTEEELDEDRKRARAAGRPIVYCGRCRELSAAGEQAFIAEGREAVIRLRMPETGRTVVRDLIHGDVEFENAQLGDFILVRSNGVPTYNFAVAVDDAAMEITHVVRGDDHLANTPRQLILLAAMGKQAPAYAHLPLILGHDRSPLSKRHGSVSVEEFRARGYVREALINYLALLGWSYDAETTLFSVDELVEKFSLERVGSTAAVFDTEKLLWMNGHYIRVLSAGELEARIEEYIKGTSLEGLPGKDGKPGLAELVPLVQEKMKTLADFLDLTDFFFLPLEFEPEIIEKLRGSVQPAAVLEKAIQVLYELPDFDTGTIEASLRRAAADMDIKVGKFLQPLRIAVSAKMVTPGMFETLAVLGREESLARLKAALVLIQ